MRWPYLLISVGFSAIFSLLVGCSGAPNFWEEARPGQKKVLVSFPPLYCIAHAVVGDDAYVLSLLTTHGPHDYDGGPTDPLKVRDADLVIFNGLSLDDAFVEKMLRNRAHPPVVSLNVGETLEKVDHAMLLHDEGHMHADGQIHKHGEHDPHIWLGPPQAIAMTKIIAARMIEIDPAHKQGYQDRAEKFIVELQKLEEHGREAFKGKKNSIVTMHGSLHYFAKAFDLEIAGTIQTKPGADPDAATLAKLVHLCQEKQVKVIAIEPQYSRSQAQTLQSNLKGKLDVRIVEIDPLETAPIPAGKRYNPDPGYYLSKMRDNIDTLARALP